MAIKKEIELEVKVDSVGTLKQQLKEAQREVEALAAKFGATSEQATNAAKKAAELKDQIGDAKALTDAFNPDAKFNAFGSALQGVAGGFSAVQGAMGLIGVESSAVEATLLKVQSAMALSQGINSVLAAKDSFTNLAAVIGKTALGQKLLTAAQVAGAATMRVLNVVMAANPVLLIVAGVTALAGAFYALTRSTDKEAEAQKELNRQHELSIRLMKQSQDEVDRYSSLLNTSSKNKIALAKAEGANSEEIFQLEKARLEEQIRYRKLAHDSGAKLSTEQYEQQKQDKYDLKILEAQHNTDINELNKKNAEAAAEASRKATESAKAAAKEAAEKAAEEKKKRDEEDAKNEEAFLLSAKDRNKNFTDTIRQNDIEADNIKRKAVSDFREYIKLQNEKDLEEARLKAEEELRIEKENQRKKLEMAANAIGVLQDAMTLFTAKNETDARRQFKINKALSLSSAVVNTALAVTAALTAGGNPIKLATGMQFVEAGIAAASGAVSIAKIAGTQFGGFDTGKSGGGGNNPSTPNNNMTQGVITPNFNIVGNNGQNQLGQLGSPIQAYVVSSDMTSQQQLDRNRLRNATF